jgi:NADH-quinone oxidoreductase subunit M
MLPMVQKILFNALTRPENRRLPDLSRREIAVLMPLVAGMLWMGVYPKPFLERADVTITTLIETVERKSTQTFFPLGMSARPPAPAPVAGAAVMPAAEVENTVAAADADTDAN